MITLLKIFPEKWEQAKGYLRLDLEALEAAMNQRWSATFGVNNLLNPDTIQGWDTTQTLYVSNEATTPEAGWPMWAQVNLANGVKNRLPFSNFVAATAASTLVGRRSTSSGDFEEISLGSGLQMQGTTLKVNMDGLKGQIPIPDEPYREDPWPMGLTTGQAASSLAGLFTAGSVIFAGPSGVLSQDNSGLFFTSATDRLGIGKATPDSELDIRNTSPIVGLYHSDTAGFAAYRFFEGTTLRSSVQHIGTTFATAGRRDDLELVTLQSTGDVVFRPNDTEVLRADSSTVTIPSGKTLTLAGLTATRVLFAGTGGLVSDDSSFVWDSTNNFLGIGITPAGTLDVSSTQSVDAAFAFRAQASHNTATAGTVYGAQFIVNTTHSSGVMNNSTAFFIQALYRGTGTATQTALVGVQARAGIAGTSPLGTVGTTRAFHIDQIVNFASGAPVVTLTQVQGLGITDVGVAHGVNGLTISNISGIAIAGTQTAATNSTTINIGSGATIPSAPSGTWGIYNASTRNSYFAGTLQFGHTTLWGSGTNFISFADGTVPGTPASNTAAIYADDVAGTVKLFGITEAGVTGELTMNSAALTSGRIALVTTNGLLVDDAGITYDATDNRINVDQVRFPGTQAASSNVNTLDDYEEGTWTPTLTFATPGDLSVVYAVRVGSYTKIGNLVRASFSIETSTFTHSTAVGSLNITGLVDAAATVTNNFHTGPLQWQGITKANYTDINVQIASAATLFTLQASGSGQNLATIAVGDMPSAGTVILRGTITYQAAT